MEITFVDHGKSWKNHGIVFLNFCGNHVLFCSRFTDLSHSKRRVFFSTAQKDVQITPLHAKIPMKIVKLGVVGLL